MFINILVHTHTYTHKHTHIYIYRDVKFCIADKSELNIIVDIVDEEDTFTREEVDRALTGKKKSQQFENEMKWREKKRKEKVKKRKEKKRKSKEYT